MSNTDKRIICEPGGPSSPGWRRALRQALDGRPWLIVTRVQTADATVRDLMAELAGLPELTEQVAEAEFDKVATAAGVLYGLPISLAQAPDEDGAVALARDFLKAQEGAQALVQA